jgi:hypothetical protein
MTSTKYIGMDVHKESISIAVMNSAGKVVMECVIETKASVILQFLNGLSGDLHVTFPDGAVTTRNDVFVSRQCTFQGSNVNPKSHVPTPSPGLRPFMKTIHED